MVMEQILKMTREATEVTAEKIKELKEYQEELVIKAKASAWEYYGVVTDSALDRYLYGKKQFNQGFEYSCESLYITALLQQRKKIILERSLGERINWVFFSNFPVFIFSKGLNRIRNPAIFTIVASLAVLPELINPFNRI
ncbi:hypothetical protein SteCoe_290 [Stentor coeruleus]|uniref:Uncharacterized protein n=1 Tax=Stentor coeruleus TaxID=5963 RepID=A0A1R2D4C3_9CILI|nr:hypothetical protein SteCoe_290 [Stentor coeruleus]